MAITSCFHQKRTNGPNPKNKKTKKKKPKPSYMQEGKVKHIEAYICIGRGLCLAEGEKKYKVIPQPAAGELSCSCPRMNVTFSVASIYDFVCFCVVICSGDKSHSANGAHLSPPPLLDP